MKHFYVKLHQGSDVGCCSLKYDYYSACICRDLLQYLETYLVSLICICHLLAHGVIDQDHSGAKYMGHTVIGKYMRKC